MNDAAFWSAIALYALFVLGAGWLATRRASRSPEEYFLAGRGLGSAVLFMALFGTNCTAFVLVGVPGLAYHLGVGTFSVNAPLVALVVPLTFWAIGVPARRLARDLGALTPAELYAKRLDSRAVGLLLFAVYTVYTLPYMVTAVDGAAVTLSGATNGAVSSELGGAAVLGVALLYTSLGGMRATAWTNVLQGALFLGFMLLAFVLFGRHVGGDRGLLGAFERVATERPDLYELPSTGLFAPAAWSSWSLAISLTVIAFPHMLVRLMSARDERAIRTSCRLYPFALILLWVPAVLIGVFGAIAFPGLEGKESDGVFALMVADAFPPALQALGFVAVLAAVMSTLDAQILTLGSMLTRDVIDPFMPNRREGRDVARGRWFGVAIAAATYALWRLGDDSIFSNAAIAFSGYVTLVPTLLLGVRWKRFTASAAIASILCGNAVYAASLWHTGANAMAPSWGGFLPVFWGLAAATVAAVGVTYKRGD